ncbi:four helix bundle protein [Candidatus Peregrinibacteria bacterium]|nr:four helix bundle protein [Candidatus Peregrinibacteria bacterium]
MHERPYKRLIAWQESYKLCRMLYESTTAFPNIERFALASQIRRAAYSMPLNIAEGAARHSKKEKAHFYAIAIGSLEELHCAIQLSLDLGYITSETFKAIDDQMNRTSFLIVKLRTSVLP